MEKSHKIVQGDIRRLWAFTLSGRDLADSCCLCFECPKCNANEGKDVQTKQDHSDFYNTSCMSIRFHGFNLTLHPFRVLIDKTVPYH